MTDEEKEKRMYELHADLCKMLSNPKRLKIIENLKNHEKTVSELVSNVGAKQANLSQHLAELRKRDLVETRKEGANVYYKIANPKIVQACDLVKEVLLEQLSENRDLIEGNK